MLLERAEITVKPGTADEFAGVMKEKGLAYLTACPGVVSVQLGRGVENPEKFMLLVHWDAMESHTAFTKTPGFTDFMQIFGPYSTGGSMEHFIIG